MVSQEPLRMRQHAAGHAHDPARRAAEQLLFLWDDCSTSHTLQHRAVEAAAQRRAPVAGVSLGDVCCDGDGADALGGQLVADLLCLWSVDVHHRDRGARLAQGVRKCAANALAAACGLAFQKSAALVRRPTLSLRLPLHCSAATYRCVVCKSAAVCVCRCGRCEPLFTSTAQRIVRQRNLRHDERKHL